MCQVKGSNNRGLTATEGQEPVRRTSKEGDDTPRAISPLPRHTFLLRHPGKETQGTTHLESSLKVQFTRSFSERFLEVTGVLWVSFQRAQEWARGKELPNAERTGKCHPGLVARSATAMITLAAW